MRLTSTLRVRQWLAKLHPPLPQTPRESQQLLRILETSFHKHLDETHPSPNQRSSTSVAQSDIPLTPVDSASSATARYFKSILNHPLIAKPYGQNQSRLSLVDNAVHAFTKGSREGTTSINLLNRCASGYLKGLKNGEKVTDGDCLAEKIASWFHTHSTAQRKSFFANATVLKLAVHVAGADGQEGIAWEWLRILYERKFGPEMMADNGSIADLKWLAVEDHLVSRLMYLSIKRGALSDAAQQYLEACRYRSASQRAAARPGDVSDALAYVPLEQSWHRLAASIVHYRTKHNIPGHLFDQVVYYGLPWARAPVLSTAAACVYHPTKPSAALLVQHLQKPESTAQFVSVQMRSKSKFRRAILTMILDAAQLSLSSGAPPQAQFLLDFARTHYRELSQPIPSSVSPSLDSQIRSAQDEAGSHFTWT